MVAKKKKKTVKKKTTAKKVVKKKTVKKKSVAKKVIKKKPVKKKTVKKKAVAKKVMKKKPAKKKVVKKKTSFLKKGMQKAAEVFGKNEKIKSKKVNVTVPNILIGLGELVSVIYKTSDGKQYIHNFKTKPILSTSETGKRLFITGGNFNVNKKGIVG